MGNLDVEFIHPGTSLGPWTAPRVLLDKGELKGLLNRYGYLPLFDKGGPYIDNHFRRFYIPGTPERALAT
jgi:hypothetical protein